MTTPAPFNPTPDNAPSQPTTSELVLMVRESLEQSSKPELRAYAKDPEFIALKVQATQRLASNLMGSGYAPHEAWDQAIREEALVR
jgi:hypothetical protein